MNDFWEKSKSDYYELKKTNEEEILNAEKNLGITLPTTYKKLILQKNGGMINFNAFLTNRPTAWAEDHIQFNHLRGLGKKSGILDSVYLIEEWELPNDQILISGDGHSWITMDYRERHENPSIHYFDAELEQNFKLADSFDEFLSKLYIHENEDFESNFIDGDEGAGINISLDDPDAITKIQAESILKTNNIDEIYKLLYFPITNTEDLKWLFGTIKENLSNLNVEKGIEIASVVDSFVHIMHEPISRDEHTKQIIKEILTKLNSLNNSEIDMLTSEIEYLCQLKN